MPKKAANRWLFPFPTNHTVQLSVSITLISIASLRYVIGPAIVEWLKGRPHQQEREGQNRKRRSRFAEVIHALVRSLRVLPLGVRWPTRLSGLSTSLFARYHRARVSTRCTWTADHSPPRGVAMFCSLSAAAICRREVAPVALIVSIAGRSSAPRLSASADLAARAAAAILLQRSSDTRRPPSWVPRALAAARAAYVSRGDGHGLLLCDSLRP